MNANKKRDFIVITVASLATFYGAYMGNVTPVALPKMAEIFGLSNIMQNWVTNIFLLTMGVLAIPLGKLCSRYGVKKTFIYSVILMLIGSIGTPLSHTIPELLIFRVIQGIGGAGLCVDSMLIIAEAISPEKRGQALGINVSCTYIGIALAPVLGGSLTYNFGWESIFWVMIPFILLNLILLFTIKEEWFKYQNEKFDLKGSIVFAIGILLLIYGFSIFNTAIGFIITVAGVLLLILFGKIELNSKYPAYDIKFTCITCIAGYRLRIIRKSKHQHYNEQCSSKRYSNGIKCSSYNENTWSNIKYWNIKCDFCNNDGKCNNSAI